MADNKKKVKNAKKNVSKKVVSKEKEIKGAVKEKSNDIKKDLTKKNNNIKHDIEKKVKEVEKDVKPIHNNKTNNKAKWLLVGAIVVLLAVVCFISVNEPPAVDPAEKMSSWIEDTKADQYVVTVIGLTYCQHCKNYNPVISSIANSENIKLYWFDIDNMDNASSSILTDTYNFEQYTGASPYTAITKNGEVIAEYVGGMGEEDTRAFLKENGVLD